MKATKTKFYWGKYIKSNEGYWTGENKEKLLDKSAILKRVKMINSDYISVGSAWSEIQQDNPFITNIKNIVYPNIYYIFPYSLLHVKKNIIFFPHEIEPFYLGRCTF